MVVKDYVDTYVWVPNTYLMVIASANKENE